MLDLARGLGVCLGGLIGGWVLLGGIDGDGQGRGLDART
jgi:hypothetical protein